MHFVAESLAAFVVQALNRKALNRKVRLMGNFSNGATSESAKVVARCRERNSRADAQSLKPRPVLSSGSRRGGMANAPTANTGASFNNSRRVTFLNLRESIRASIRVAPASRRLSGGRLALRHYERQCNPHMGFLEQGKVTAGSRRK